MSFDILARLGAQVAALPPRSDYLDLTTTTLGKRKWLRFGQWNVKTLFQIGKLAQAGHNLEKFNLDFLAVSEVRWNQCGQIVTSNGHLMLYSGMPNEEDVHQYGVGILINRRFRQSVMTYRFINECIMTVRFKGSARNLSVTQCYAPTEDAETEIKEAFYDTLNTILAEVPKRDLVLLMGDFNAQVGENNEDIEHVMGRHGVGRMTENGELLVECCGLNKLKIGGTLFPHKKCHKVTWVSPDSHTENQIDHICVSAKWSNALADVRVKRSADIGSDHHLLVGHLRLTTKKVPKKKTNPRKKFEIAKLKSDAQRTTFSNTLRENLANTNPDYNNIQQAWGEFKNAVLKTCEDKLGMAKNRKQDFISPNTWSVIESRSEAKNETNAATTIHDKIQAKQRYSILDKRVKREIRNDKREHLNSLASQAEAAAAVYNMKDLYTITKRIANTNRSRNVPVKDKNGVLLTNVEDQLKRWREHFQEVLNLRRDGIVIPPTRATRSLPIRTSPPSRKEITDAIKSLKNGKAAGIDSITGEVLKADVNLSTDALLPLLTAISEKGEFLDGWNGGKVL
ncbi:craniofacial development protein 2-like [Culicoides brevitarsis]|uniref:craniofacial development protein 2-like n=1 Tax=Culicoides brevitarsis TaxID=469753 RepID=UPI00307BD5F1